MERVQLIDTHCHLYVKDFDSDIDEVMDRARQQGVQKFYLPNIDSDSIDVMLQLEAKYPGECIAMMGLHPCSVNNQYQQQLATVEEWLKKRSFAAVGEIGLDFYWDKTFKTQQHEAFHQQIEWAKQYNIPIVIHTREAMQASIDVVQQHAGPELSGIFHCFSGTVKEAEQIIAMGFYLGIGGVITYKKAGIREAIIEIDLKHLVLETDAPYLTPVPHRGKRNESSYLKHVVETLAELKNISVEEIAAVTTANAEKIFQEK